jgi:hypothetical protein
MQRYHVDRKTGTDGTKFLMGMKVSDCDAKSQVRHGECADFEVVDITLKVLRGVTNIPERMSIINYISYIPPPPFLNRRRKAALQLVSNPTNKA